ncbi:MAG: GTP 3',8-cyclase MoaA [Alphaproteobacteria bacterium]|nr:GTP 3',8-cyclase MoaA [Alphaproteobacteria bacterium]
MQDSFGRQITYLRLSVTDRCDLRCVYCMPAMMKFLPKSEVLELEELATIATSFIGLGVKKIRVTGGEPLVRKNIIWLIERLGKELQTDGGLNELTLTTNGTQLGKFAPALFAAGVRRVNVSLDSLRPAVFARLTRGGDVAVVLDSIAKAKAAGLQVKINMVALRGINDIEIHDMISWCGDHGHDLTFIEVMPMGEVGITAGKTSKNDGTAQKAKANGNSNSGAYGDEDSWAVRAEQYWPLSLLRAEVMTRWQLTRSDYRSAGPASYYDCRETGRRIGFITPLTNHFCASCNRVRLTTTGKLYLCLGQDNMVDLRAALHKGGVAHLNATIREAMKHKPLSHDFVISRWHKDPSQQRAMNQTGG